jgi:hypothetical protein
MCEQYEPTLGYVFLTDAEFSRQVSCPAHARQAQQALASRLEILYR